MNEIVEFLRGELGRVQNERDAAQANERQLWAIIAELREQNGLLSGLADIAHDAADNDEHVRSDAFEAIKIKVGASRTRVNSLMDTRAVAK